MLHCHQINSSPEPECSLSMIPLKLQLKNFLSYGAMLQTVDFSPYHLICLSGKNGHGKSALLDAITWAIWGQARKISGVAKADNHLLRLGQQQMLVILDFEFNRQQYRIRREFALTHGKQYASLDFALIEGEKTVSLTNKTIRETQATIETTLGLDFESFINSAFLRQGQSNEFSKKSPKERKDILGTILGLNHYELLKKRALDKVKNATSELLHLAKFQEKLKEELHKLPELTTTLLTVNQSIKILEDHEKLCCTQKSSLTEKKEHLLTEKNNQALITLQRKQKEEEITQLTVQVVEDFNQWRSLHKKYVRYIPSEDHEKQKQNLINQIAHHQNEQQKFLLLKEKQLNLKQQEHELIAQIKSNHAKKVQESSITVAQVQNELTSKQNQADSLEKQKTGVHNELSQLNSAVKSHNDTIEALKFIVPQLQKEEKIFEKRKYLYRQWGAEMNNASLEIKKLQQRQKLTSDETNPSCPLCEQNLSASRKKFLKNIFVQKEDFLKHRLSRLTLLINSLKQQLTDQNKIMERLKVKAEEYKTAEIKHNELVVQTKKVEDELEQFITQKSAQEQEVTVLTTKCKEQQASLKALYADEKQLLSQNNEYMILNKELNYLNEILSTIGYNQEHFDALRAQLTKLEEIAHQAQLIEQELTKKKLLANSIAEQCRIIKNIKLIINELNARNAQYNSLEEELKQIYTIETTLNQTAQKYQKEKEALLQQRGSLEKERMTLVNYESEFKIQEKKIKELQEHCYDYQTIATALGKDGIQALIIEDALPEIEQEANDLLGQLTDNQAHIIIESLRDLKKGGTKETLDIKISDSIGIRPYELFSGGEAFRIDFALRLAISKLLARRAGTSLQTLIIDEGFGSQDEDGLSHIMDALYKIQNSFCKIIIVSHLPSMKDQFPVHFFVEKGTQGSSMRVIEQG